MEENREKMNQFVDRLWNNPAIKNAPLLKRENQILSFIKENSESLKKSLTSSNYFPDLKWEEIVRLMFTAITGRVLSTLEPRVDALLRTVYTHDLLVLFDPDLPPDEVRPGRLLKFIMNAMRTKTLRDQYIYALDAISYGFFDRYIPAALERKKVIYYELARRDKLDLSPMDMIRYLAMCSMFRPLFWYRVQIPEKNQMVSLSTVSRGRRSYLESMNVMHSDLQKRVGNIPLAAYRPGLDSFLNAHDVLDLSGSARMISILVSMAQEYDPAQAKERGAESIERSWFHVNRRTANYYGYDAKILDELYLIAGEEGW